MLKKIVWLALIALVVFAALPADAADGKWKLRGRIIDVAPTDESDEIDTGVTLEADSATALEVDVTYMFSEKWGLEVIAAMPSHDVNQKGGEDNGFNYGSADLIPPCFTAQYFFGKGKVKPYIGAGFNYTLFSFDESQAVKDAGLEIDLSDEFGFLVNGGIDWNFGKGGWLFNFDVKYVDLSTTATVKAGGVEVAKVDVGISPWIIGAGFGYRF
jgi:outer membrane protein